MNVTFHSAARLIQWCARLEFALHEIPEYLIRGRDDVPSIDWGRFQVHVRDDVSQFTGVADRATLLGDDGVSPPKKMLVENGRVIFKSFPIDGPDGDRLLIASRRVRNNLVHGGKETARQQRYDGHDQALVDAAYRVISIAAGVNRAVAELCYDGIET